MEESKKEFKKESKEEPNKELVLEKGEWIHLTFQTLKRKNKPPK